MKERCWLLPFMHGVDMRAIDAVVRIAEASGVSLIAVSLLSAAHEERFPEVRLEYIQQSKDFLEVVKWKARQYSVPLESYEVFTADVLQSFTLLIHDLGCDSIVLVTTEGKDLLLHASEKKCLLENPPAPLIFLRLATQAQRIWTRHLGTRFLSWLHQLWRQQDDGWCVQDVPAVEEPSWIRTEEHHRR
jgi:hypothetical protein